MYLIARFFKGLFSLSLLLLTSCSTIQGYPHDPEDDDATLAGLQSNFTPDAEKPYYEALDSISRRRIRDMIVLNRIRAFDIEFDKFAQSLSGDRNGLTVSSDLIVLALNGVGATTGGAATKAALAAASAGVVGAQGSINKDLFYDRTVPALLAQIQANRIRVKTTIIDGLASSDDDYPLPRASIDLEALKEAGGLPNAISDITQQASINRKAAQTDLDSLRTVKFSFTSTGQLIDRWIHTGGQQINSGRRALLTSWLARHGLEIPFQLLINAPSLESTRISAIADLSIR